MIVNIEKCIGCKLCANDCPTKCISMKENKADINKNNCIKCGHCLAICPKFAITSDEYDMTEVKEYNKETFSIESENLMNFIKFRRSVRSFKNEEVSKETIEKIIEAGRFTQTGVNSQDVSYIVIRDGLEELRKLTLEGLNKKAEEILNNLNEETKKYERYARIWKVMYREYARNPKTCQDRIFFNAPLVILVVSKTATNGVLASKNMELMTNALGLGTFYSGFLEIASRDNREMTEFLGLKNGEEIATCMVIGYPKVTYKRTVPRKKAEIIWK